MRDFVVVGAGPAGSRFARRAAEHGYDVILFEQGEIGEPLACSGHVSTDIWSFLPDDAYDDLFQNAITGARFHLGGPGSSSYPFYKDNVISNAIDRVGLDRVLATEAENAGADVRDHHTVTELTEHADHVTVSVSGPDGLEEFAAKMIAGCDGPQSRVRRELGLPAPNEFLHGVLGFDMTPDYDDFVDVHLTVPGFFAWRIPRGDAGVEYGLATTPGVDVGDRFDEFTNAYQVDLETRCSGVIPLGSPDRVSRHRGFLIGDAAAQTKPFTGGGILYGMTAADCAAQVIDPDRPETLETYESAWRSTLNREQWLGRLIRTAYSFPAPVQRIGLRLFSGRIGVHMDRPSSLFSREQLKALFSR